MTIGKNNHLKMHLLCIMVIVPASHVGFRGVTSALKWKSNYQTWSVPERTPLRYKGLIRPRSGKPMVNALFIRPYSVDYSSHKWLYSNY